MTEAILEYVRKCPECQKFKVVGKRKYATHPMSTLDRGTPREVVHLDMVGAWTIKLHVTNKDHTMA